METGCKPAKAFGSPLKWPAVLTAAPTLNKFYSPLIRPHAWKFFSNPHTDHDTYHRIELPQAR